MKAAQREYIWFVLVRLVGVGVRPLILLVALNVGASQFATHYALVITAIASSYVIYANQNHRALYNFFLNAASPRRGLGGKAATLTYFDGVAIHMVAFTPVTAAFVWIWVESAWLLWLVLPLVIIEKYYDDHQRALIYKKRFAQWSMHFGFRLIAPNAVMLIVIISFGTSNITLYSGLVIASAATYLIVFDRAFTRIVARWLATLGRRAGAGITGRIKAYFANYLSEYLGAQIFTILAINMILIDRFFVRTEFTPIFAEYIFAVNVFGMISVFHNIFHFTRIRHRLIAQTCPVWPTIFSFRNISMPLALAIGALAFFPVAHALGLLDRQLKGELLLGLAAVHMISAVSLVVKELSFWRVRRHWLVLIDVVIIALMCGALVFVTTVPDLIPWILAMGLAVRALVLCLCCATRNEVIRLPR